MWLTDSRDLKRNIYPMLFQSPSPQDLTSKTDARTNMPHHMHSSLFKIVSFNVWDVPYWFVKNRKQRMLHIAEYLQRLDAEIICLQEAFDVHHRRLLYDHLGLERYYASGGFEETRKAPLAEFDTTGGLVILSKFPIIQATFRPFNQFTPSLIERIGRKGVLEATLETPYGLMQIFNIHLHMGRGFVARSIRFRQLRSILERVKMQRHLPIILAGDFNENIHAEHQKLMTMLQSIGLTHSLYFEQYEYMPSYRRTNPLVNNWLNREKYSRRLDYIFVGL